MDSRHYSCRIFFLLLSFFFIAKVFSREGSYFFYQQPEYPRDCKDVYSHCSSDNSSGVYTIKPDGYPTPFEVYCENQMLSGGWTVIQRQTNGLLTFKRNWEDYRNGFGFLSNEFYIGNEKLAYLTNQEVYELRIDMKLSNGSHFYVNYKFFRISDEWSQYALVRTEEFSGNSSCVATSCPTSMVRESCSCRTSCRDPIGMADCSEICEETCVPKRCFVPEESSFILNGNTYVNSDCSRRCTCNNDQLNCDSNYQCSSNGACREHNNVRQCYCNPGYVGDGVTCTPYTDCNDVQNAGITQSGVYSIRPAGYGSSFDVYCNMTIDGGGWTVFQRRINGATDFYRNWESYKNGFGNIPQEFWLGNEKIHHLTQQATYEFRVDFVHSSSSYHDKYIRFRIDSESNKYRMASDLSYRGGTKGLSLQATQNISFSTYDQDNDPKTYTDCAKGHRSGWWHGGFTYGIDSCYAYPDGRIPSTCSVANYNGDYNGGNGENIFHWFGDACHLTYVEMKIRRTS